MAINSNFDFTNDLLTEPELPEVLELPIEEHFIELRQRVFIVFGILLLFTCLAFIELRSLVKILELPISNVKFFQVAPGEYFVTTLKISLYTGLLFTSPFFIWQVLLFLIPGLTQNEIKLTVPVLISSLVLFVLGLVFSYFTLVPAALNFLLSYSEGVLEPFWSFDQYFEFILVLFYSTGLAFQIPIIQVLLGILDVVSPKQMLNVWRYVIVFSTIFGAVLTPSTDPLTQLLLSIAILFLYFSGVGILFLIKN